ncbi:MAG: thioesterase family protein [Bacteroidota bacterium]
MRYADTDKMGFAYYGNYPKFYEIARVEAFRALQYSYREMEDGGVGMPVLNLAVDYHKPAKYDDLLTIEVLIPEMPRARILFHYKITNEAGDLINTGTTTLAFMQLNSGRPVKMPTKLQQVLKPYFS